MSISAHIPAIVVENLRAAVYASHEELSAQGRADSALDAKLLGLLGFFFAAASILLTVPHGLRDGRILLLVGAGLGALACLLGSIGDTGPRTGPPPKRFYSAYGAKAEPDYLLLLLDDLAATIRRNHRTLDLRRRTFAFAVWIPILLAGAYGLLALL